MFSFQKIKLGFKKIMKKMKKGHIILILSFLGIFNSFCQNRPLPPFCIELRYGTIAIDLQVLYKQYYTFELCVQCPLLGHKKNHINNNQIKKLQLCT
jgi:hypothetical protein